MEKAALEHRSSAAASLECHMETLLCKARSALRMAQSSTGLDRDIWLTRAKAAQAELEGWEQHLANLSQ